jgi:hypothetical protein
MSRISSSSLTIDIGLALVIDVVIATKERTDEKAYTCSNSGEHLDCLGLELPFRRHE